MAGALGWFWHMRGHAAEGRRRLEQLLARAPEPTEGRAKALCQTGLLAFMQGDPDAVRTAGPLAEEGLALSRQLGYTEGMARAIHVQVAVEHFQGSFERAAALLDDNLPIFEAEGSKPVRLLWLYARSQAALSQGEHERAVRILEEGLALSRELGDTWGTCHWLLALGHLALRRGEPERALTFQRESLVLRLGLEDRRGAAESLEGLGWTAAARGRPEAAARLMGAAEALRESIAHSLLPIWTADHEQAVATARSRLGDAAFEAAWSAARALPLDEVIAYALADDDSQPSATRAADVAAGPSVELLTAREREIAALLAQGFTNRQIADALVISEGTAGTHVGNILRKLDFATRAQVAAWAVRHGLADLPRS